MSALREIVAYARTIETDILAPTVLPVGSLMTKLGAGSEGEKGADSSNQPA